MALIPPSLSLLDAHHSNIGNTWSSSNTSVQRLRKTSFTIVLTGSALLVASFIQAHLFGLTVYHAVIVLNLSWLINLTAVISVMLRWGLDGNGMKGLSDWQKIKSREVAMYTAHFCATGALGIWLFSNVDKFDITQKCSDSTVFYVFSHFVRVENPRFRIFWLVIYSLTAIPILNWCILICMLVFTFLVMYLVLVLIIVTSVCVFTPCVLCCCGAKRRGEADEAKDDSNLPDFTKSSVGLLVVLSLVLDVLLIVSTEETINHNTVGSGESEWGFGQTLALLVMLLPAIEVWEDIRGTWKRLRGNTGLSEADILGGEEKTAHTPEQIGKLVLPDLSGIGYNL
jgi:hypothetical protein